MNQLTIVQKDAAPLKALITPEQALQQLESLRQLVKAYLERDTDYGKMPGTDKDTLFKSGAEKLCDIYGFHPKYNMHSSREDWDRSPELFDYTVECTILRADGTIAGSGLGSCSSYESKYRWRKGQRVCPDCNQPAIRQSKPEYGAGYYCDRKANGCGTSFQRNATARRNPTEEEVIVCQELDRQSVDRVQNTDMADVKNTVLKMAKKRAYVDAVISATRSSGIFTQDLDDFIDAVIVQPKQVSAADIQQLAKLASERGFSKEAVQKFMKDAESKGASRVESYEAARKHFLEDANNDDNNDAE